MATLSEDNMAKGTLITVTPEGNISAEAVEVPQGEETGSFIYQKLYDAVGGSIETIPLFETIKFPKSVITKLSATPGFDLNGFDVTKTRPCAAFCNEYGKVYDLAYNEFGTALWAMALVDAGQATIRDDGSIPMSDIANGPVVIVTGDDAFMATI